MALHREAMERKEETLRQEALTMHDDLTDDRATMARVNLRREKARVDLGEPPKAMGIFDKMGLSERFWEFVQQDFAYTQDTPSLAGLLRSLFVSEFMHQKGGDRIDALDPV